MGSTGIPPRYGGFETYAYQIGLLLKNKYSVWVACSKSLYAVHEQNELFEGIHRFFIAKKPNGASSLLYDYNALKYVIKHSRRDDVVLILGCGPGLLIPFFKGLKHRKLIIHPDGVEWKRAKWNPLVRRIIWLAWQLSLKYAWKIVLDNKALASYVPSRYLIKTNVCSYGADHLPGKNLPPNPVEYKYALVIARAEPENNLDLILRAFTRFTKLHLLVISNYSATRYGKKLFKRYGNYNSIHFIEAIYHNAKLLQAYRKNCEVYIHGHSAGGTNPSLIEAMMTGKPVLCMDNKFNRSTTFNKARFFHNEESLLRKLTIADKNAKNDAMEMQQLAFKHYNWQNIGKCLESIIENNE